MENPIDRIWKTEILPILRFHRVRSLDLIEDTFRKDPFGVIHRYNIKINYNTYSSCCISSRSKSTFLVDDDNRFHIK